MRYALDQSIQRRVIALALICGAMIVVHLVNIASGGWLSTFGIRPRHFGNLYAILTAPWLHENIAHLGNNLVSLLIFGALILLGGFRHFLKASAIIIIASGLLLWLLGRDGVHLGASGWIFGLWSLAIARAWYDRSYRNIAISIVVILVHGGMAYGMLPTSAYISFESHIFGALAGILAARMLRGAALLQPAPASPLQFWP